MQCPGAVIFTAGPQLLKSERVSSPSGGQHAKLRNGKAPVPPGAPSKSDKELTVRALLNLAGE